MLAAGAGRWPVVCCACGGCRKVAGGLLCLRQVQEGGRWSVVIATGAGRWPVICCACGKCRNILHRTNEKII